VLGDENEWKYGGSLMFGWVPFRSGTCRSRKDEGQKVPANVISGNLGRGVGLDSTGKMNSFGTGNCDPARTPQRFCAHPRGPHGASLGPCAGGVGVPARAWGRAGGALECAVWVQTAQRYEIGTSGWLPGGPSTRTATAQPLGDLATPQRTGDPPVGSHVGEGAGEGKEGQTGHTDRAWPRGARDTATHHALCPCALRPVPCASAV
jgi:hypothetical protein